MQQKHFWRFVIGLALMTMATALGQSEADPPVSDTLAVADTAAISVPAPLPVTNLIARDKPNDRGYGISLSWDLSPDDTGGTQSVLGYRIMRSTTPDGPWDSINVAGSGDALYDHIGPRHEGDSGYFPDHTDMYYRVDVLTADPGVAVSSGVVGPVQSRGQWFNTARTVVFLFMIAFCGLVIWFVTHARRGKDLYVRPLAGIEAVDEAVGRATEMGKPILYLCGLGDAAEVPTIASFTILGRVAKRVAEYQTQIIVPCRDPIVMTVAQEVVKTAYSDAGRPDSYNPDSVFFLTIEQFAYVAGVNGIMLRDKPATNVYMGKFYAESLIFAETGTMAGSIQIAGTDEIPQIPFFFVACDYTLIGEELYAASAYLSREPVLLGSLKAQDYAKAAIIVFAILGFLATNVSALGGPEWLAGFVDLFQVRE